MTHIVSYGGGVNSTAMVIFMLNNNQPIDHIVFCDTGAEMPDTLAYITEFDKYLANYGKKIEVLYPKERLYDHCMRLNILPIRNIRWCTSNFKVRLFNDFVMKHMPIVSYIGFDAGEENRVLNSETPYYGKNCKNEKFNYEKRYPLFQNGIDRIGCINMIRDANLPIPPKSGCFICPFKTPREYWEMKRSNPDLFIKAMELENKHRKRKTILKDRSLSNIWNQQELFADNSYEIELPCGCHDGGAI